jgi:hypothetical protein
MFFEFFNAKAPNFRSLVVQTYYGVPKKLSLGHL